MLFIRYLHLLRKFYKIFSLNLFFNYSVQSKKIAVVNLYNQLALYHYEYFEVKSLSWITIFHFAQKYDCGSIKYDAEYVFKEFICYLFFVFTSNNSKFFIFVLIVGRSTGHIYYEHFTFRLGFLPFLVRCECHSLNIGELVSSDASILVLQQYKYQICSCISFALYKIAKFIYSEKTIAHA